MSEPLPRRALTAIAASAAIALASAAGLAPAPAQADPVTIADQNGATVTLDGPAERIATIPIPAASMVVAIDGGTDRLAGMHPLSKTALTEAILGEFFPASVDIPSDVVGQGFMPNVEALLALDPDLVLQWAHRGDDILAPLRNAGFTVAALRYGTEELTRGWIEMLGTATGNTEKAAELIAWREQAQAEITGLMADLSAADRPRTVYFLRYLSELRVAGEGTYNDFYIDLAGGTNPAAADGSGWLTVNPEQVLAWDPEVILLNGFEDDLSPADVYANPLFADVTAIRDRRVYKVPLGGYRWDPPNQESPLMWRWLAMLLQPDRADWPLRTQIVEAYGWIYGQTPTEAQIDGILRLAMNGDAAYYDRFAGDAGR